MEEEPDALPLDGKYVLLLVSVENLKIEEETQVFSSTMITWQKSNPEKQTTVKVAWQA